MRYLLNSHHTRAQGLASPIISPTLGPEIRYKIRSELLITRLSKGSFDDPPMVCTPRMQSVSSSTRNLTWPSVSRFVLARELARNGNWPTLYTSLRPSSSARSYLPMPLPDAYIPRSESSHNPRGPVLSVHTFDIRNASVELIIDHDTPEKIDFNADVFEIEALDIWPTADGNKNNIGFELMNFRL